MMSYRSFIALLIVLAALTAIASPAVSAVERPNIVMFLVDDMGWVDCGAYGSEYYETPNIDQFATQGMLFTDAYTAHPLCSPTRASILSGKFPARLGLTTAAGHQPPLPADSPRYPDSAPPGRATIQPISLRYLAPQEYTIAEALRDAGYHTAHMGKWHLGLTPEYWPDQQGFDVKFHGAPDPGPRSYFSPYQFKAGNVTNGPDGEYITDRLTDEAVKFIRKKHERPFLLHVWQYGVHGPWGHKVQITRTFEGKVDPRGRQNNPIMASMLKSVDESLGRILAALDEQGLADNTIVIFFSDNGGNVHSQTPGNGLPPTNNYPLRKGKAFLFEGGVRVPLIVRWPGVVEPGSRCSTPVQSIDFYPTMLEMAGVVWPRQQKLDGVSIVPLLKQTGTIRREAIFNFFPHGGPNRPPGVTVRRGDFKLIRWFETGGEYTEPLELYNLADDIGETRNLASAMPEKVSQLNALIDGFLADTGALIPKPNPAYNPRAGRAADALDGWVPKSCDVTPRDGALSIAADGRSPFIAYTRFNQLKQRGPLVMRIRARGAAGGEGRVQWRTTTQDSFPDTGQIVSYTLPGDGAWHDVDVMLPIDGVLRHVRLYLPADRAPIEIDRIELRPADVAPSAKSLMSWDF